jgi:hypothetical protein
MQLLRLHRAYSQPIQHSQFEIGFVNQQVANEHNLIIMESLSSEENETI